MFDNEMVPVTIGEMKTVMFLYPKSSTLNPDHNQC